MPYNPKGEIRDHWRRIAADLVNFRGRSRRSELVAYWLATMVIGVGFVVTGWLVPTMDQVKGEWLQFLLAIPLIPIIARRLHDQNRSAWFALIVPVAVGLKAYAYWRMKRDASPLRSWAFRSIFLKGR